MHFMGYDLHITRAEDWADNEESPISAEEWLAAAAADPELRLGSPNGPYFADWVDLRTGAERGWLDWSDGDIFTKHPDRALLGKMLELAARLGARVQGDDGELYSRVEDLPGNEKSQASRRRPWWRLW
jgi:hypothetical protein